MRKVLITFFPFFIVGELFCCQNQSQLIVNHNEKRHFMSETSPKTEPSHLLMVISHSVTEEKSEKLPELEEILAKCSVYCKKLVDMHLDIACQEKIIETNWVRPGDRLAHARKMLNIKILEPRKVGNYYVTEREWIYDYKFNRNNQEIKEQRVLIKEDGLGKKVKDAKLHTNFSHKYNIHGPLSLLAENWQNYHDFKLIGKETLWGEKATIIEAVPKPGFSMPHALGRIWVSKDAYNILKMEWNGMSVKGNEYAPKNAKMNLITEYKFEKNGIRFPRQHTLEVYDESPKKYTWKTEIKVIYEDYRFFTVENEVKVKEPELEEFLEKSVAYCKKLADVVLDIVCLEKIDETIQSRYFVGTSKINKYVYDYQLIRKKRRITEQRILIEENGKDRNERNAELKTKFQHEYMILGPYGLLSKEKQPYQNYRIVGKKKLWGKEAVIIEAVPRPGVTLDHSWGKIWVSKDDYSILKIEWDQRSIKGIGLLPENIEIYMATEYKFEKNGIRFPSQFTLEENEVSHRKYVVGRKHKFRMTEIMVTYKDYKFFTVETETKIKG